MTISDCEILRLRNSQTANTRGQKGENYEHQSKRYRIDRHRHALERHDCQRRAERQGCKQAVHSVKSAHPKMAHPKASKRVVRKGKTTGQTKMRHSLKVRHSLKKAR